MRVGTNKNEEYEKYFWLKMFIISLAGYCGDLMRQIFFILQLRSMRGDWGQNSICKAYRCDILNSHHGFYRARPDTLEGRRDIPWRSL